LESAPCLLNFSISLTPRMNSKEWLELIQWLFQCMSTGTLLIDSTSVHWVSNWTGFITESTHLKISGIHPVRSILKFAPKESGLSCATINPSTSGPSRALMTVRSCSADQVYG